MPLARTVSSTAAFTSLNYQYPDSGYSELGFNIGTMSGALHSSNYTRFRALIVQARKDAGVTQTQLSEQIGRPQSFVSKYEGGERRLDVIEFIEVCDALGISPQTIINALRKGGAK